MAKKIDQEIINLYDDYTHKPLPRREFLEKLTKIVGGSAAALALLPQLQNNYAQAAIIPESDGRLEITTEKFKLGDKEISAYVAKPKDGKNLPAVVVIHENRGLNPHIEDITRRLAIEGFLAVAPDALSLSGGTPDDEDRARDMIKALDKDETQKLYKAAIKYAKQHPASNRKVGALGFCWGGGMANWLAANCGNIDSVVSYYGMQPSNEDAQSISIPLMLHYAGLDERINKGITNYVENLNAGGVAYTLHFYPRVNHAFNNDTNAARYNKDAAKLSWKRSVEFFKTNL